MLYLYQSVDTISLFEAWKQQVSRPVGRNVLQPRTIIVPNMDIASWLQVHLSEQEGIAANLDFQLPAGFFRAQFERMDPEVRGSLLDKPRLRWMIFTLLGEAERDGGYPDSWDVLMDWIRSRSNGTQVGRSGQGVRWDLAGQIGDVFDQYIMYRPDWLLAWERGEQWLGEGEDPGFMYAWQPSFWKWLMDRWAGTRHRAGLLREWLERLGNDQVIREALPETIHIFNVKQVPPALIEALMACSKEVDVHWYLSEHAFVGAYDDRFFKGLNTEQVEFRELFDEVAGRSGAQVVRFRVGAAHGTVAPVLERVGGVAVHRCHSAHREVEVLRDRLMELFDTTELRPHEVAVVTPDPDLYAPFMREAFQVDSSDGVRIPVRILGGRKTDRALVSEAILQALHVAGTRFKVTEVMDWMGQAPVLGRYMDEHRLRPVLHRWIDEQMIRWGSDRAHVSTSDFELNGRHTWEHGLERLLLAKIGSEDQDFEFQGVLSGSSVITQAETVFLGRVMQAFDALERLREASKSTESVSFWVEFLSDVIHLCIDSEWKEAVDQVRAQLYDLAKIDELVGLEAVSLSIIHSYLKEQLQKSGLGRSWHPGEVTFTGMVSLHEIPFKVIAVVGLNDGSMPGRTPVSAFDMIPKFKRKGDRVRRLADRQLFLDYLCTPSEHLYLSYTGLRQTDNKVIAPSVMIPLMEDHLKRLSKDGRFCVPIEYHHRLQPFHPEYFSGSGVMHSYSLINAELAAQLDGGNAERSDTLLPELTPARIRELKEMGPLGEVLAWKRDTEVGVASFMSYFVDPCRYVLKDVIGVDLREGDVPSDDDEPLGIDGLSAWKMRNEMVGSVVDHWAATGSLPSRERVEAQLSGFVHRYEVMGWVPDALAGQSRLRDIVDQSRDLIREFEGLVSGLTDLPLTSHELDLDVDLGSGLGFRIKGSLPLCAGNQYVVVEVGKASPARDLKYWMNHVLLNTVEPVDSTIIYRDDSPTLMKFASMDRDAALRIVHDLGWFFVLGQRHLMPLYASMSEQYISNLSKGFDSISSLYALQDALSSDDAFNRSLDDVKSEWVRHVWREVELLGTSVENAESGVTTDELDSVSGLDVEVLTKIDAFRVFSELIYRRVMEDQVK
jgi:exodeoxyribonuclease V gamma subunit